VPSFSSPASDWAKPWEGYVGGWGTPRDVDTGDIKKIRLSEGWEKYSLYGRLRASGAEVGILAHAQAHLWNNDLSATGQSYIVTIDQQTPHIKAKAQLGNGNDQEEGDRGGLVLIHTIPMEKDHIID